MSSLYQDLNVTIITFSAEQASRQNSRKMQKSHLIISNCPFLFPGTSLYVIRMIGPIVLGQSKTIWNSLYQSSRGKSQWALSSSFEICQQRRVQHKLAQHLESSFPVYIWSTLGKIENRPDLYIPTEYQPFLRDELEKVLRWV